MGIFSTLFGKTSHLDMPADLSVLRADIHSHLIPGIDDGAQNIEHAVTLARSLSELGYRKLITTPHVMSDHFKNTEEIINNGLEQLKKAVEEAAIPVDIRAAAEYYLDDEFEKMIDEKRLLTFGNNMVLFELPTISDPPGLALTIKKLQKNGYKPVLAHVERYGFWYHDFSRYKELYQMGVSLQLNIISLSGAYSPIVRRISERLVDEGIISFLGTDCHNLDQIQLIRETLREKYLHKLLNSGRILNDSL